MAAIFFWTGSGGSRSINFLNSFCLMPITVVPDSRDFSCPCKSLDINIYFR